LFGVGIKSHEYSNTVDSLDKKHTTVDRKIWVYASASPASKTSSWNPILLSFVLSVELPDDSKKAVFE